MAVTAIAPLDAAFPGLVGSFASLRRELVNAVIEKNATEQQKQILHLIEFAASRFGDPLLHAIDPDELDDRLDELTDSRELGFITELLLQHVSLFQTPDEEPSSVFTETFGSALATVLGEEPARMIVEAQPILNAWLDAQRQAISLVPKGAPAKEVPDNVNATLSSSVLTDPDIPPTFARAAFHGVRASICTLAILQNVVSDAPVRPWIVLALVERLLVSVGVQLRLLASLPGISVDEAIVPASERLDIEAIVAGHQRARQVAKRQLEAARARLSH